MSDRTQQDNNIKNYSVNELRAMLNRLTSSSSMWHPFTLREVCSELNARNFFLKEWTEKEFKTIKQAIKKHFLFKAFRTNQGIKTLYTYSDIENLLGLPYTSSSSYAGVWVTNSEVYSHKSPELHYIGFTIGEDQKPYAILWDNEENETLLPL